MLDGILIQVQVQGCSQKFWHRFHLTPSTTLSHTKKWKDSFLVLSPIRPNVNKTISVFENTEQLYVCANCAFFFSVPSVPEGICFSAAPPDYCLLLCITGRSLFLSLASHVLLLSKYAYAFSNKNIWNQVSPPITFQRLNILKNYLVRVPTKGVAMLFWKYFSGNSNLLSKAIGCSLPDSFFQIILSDEFIPKLYKSCMIQLSINFSCGPLYRVHMNEI